MTKSDEPQDVPRTLEQRLRADAEHLNARLAEIDFDALHARIMESAADLVADLTSIQPGGGEVDEQPDVPGEVYTIPWDVIQTAVWSEDELDGFDFTDDESGGTIVTGYGGMWALNLLLLTLAKAVAPLVQPDRKGHAQLYHTMAELTFDMTRPVDIPYHQGEGYSFRLPNLRIAR